MTKPKRIIGYSPFGQRAGDIEPFSKLFTHKLDITIEGAMEQIDCLILWGGTDIHPGYYRQSHGRLNGAPAEPSRRDEMEWKAMLFCKKNDIPMIGVCRGAQFMCAFAGGKLIQHVASHGYDHMMETSRGDRVYTTSSHHQMMYPFDVPHQLLAWAQPRISNTYLNGDNAEIEEMKAHPEPEIVYFDEIRALAIQGHPEYGSATAAYKKLCCDMASEFLFNEKVMA